MTKWNFNENKNFIKVGDYKVLNLPDAEKASELLEKINTHILVAFISIELKEPRTPEINLLLSTPFKLQEMQLPEDQGEIIFEGLNKPKGVKPTNEIIIGKDGRLRAKSRLIFLQLRNNKGNLKSISSLRELIAHELAHTAMNHVTWRDDDHNEDYEHMLKIIRKYI